MTDDAATPPVEKLWIDYMPVDELIKCFDERNPKGHDIDELRASMDRFGYTEPIMLDERTGKLLSGHGRVELLHADWSNERSAPEGVLVQEEPEQGWRWYVATTRGYRSGDDIEAGAYLIAANKLVERGGWVADPLAALLALVAESGDLVGTGYSDDDLDALLTELAKGADSDAAPESSRTGVEPEFVSFRFGDIGGLVKRATYDTFRARYDKARSDQGTEPMLDDIITRWLGSDDS